MKQKDLEDKNTREAIFDFIENHPGGVDGALSDVERDTKYGQDDQVLPSASKSKKAKDREVQNRKERVQSDSQTGCQEQDSFQETQEKPDSTQETPEKPGSTLETPEKPGSTPETPPPTPAPPSADSSSKQDGKPSSNLTLSKSSPTISSNEKTSPTSPRNDLLSAIRKGARLNPVEPNQDKKNTLWKKEEDMMWGPLKEIIEQRKTPHIGDSDSDERFFFFFLFDKLRITRITIYNIKPLTNKRLLHLS